MEGNQEKVFMTIHKRITLFISFVIVLGYMSCENDVPVDELPPATFPDIVIDLGLPAYQNLTRDGGFEPLPQGLRGIILYRENASTYHAIEQNCTYLPFEAGSTVNVDPNNPSLLRDASCGSIFTLPDVFPGGGPAVLPLRKYSVTLNGRILTITSEPIN